MVPASVLLQGALFLCIKIRFSLLTLLAVQPGKGDSGRGCGHLPEQRGEQRTSENSNHLPCHADTTQEGQPAAALEEGSGRAGFVALPHAALPCLERIKRIVYSCDYQSQSFGLRWSNWGNLPSACTAKIRSCSVEIMQNHLFPGTFC